MPATDLPSALTQLGEAQGCAWAPYLSVIAAVTLPDLPPLGLLALTAASITRAQQCNQSGIQPSPGFGSYITGGQCNGVQYHLTGDSFIPTASGSQGGIDAILIGPVNLHGPNFIPPGGGEQGFYFSGRSNISDPTIYYEALIFTVGDYAKAYLGNLVLTALDGSDPQACGLPAPVPIPPLPPADAPTVPTDPITGHPQLPPIDSPIEFQPDPHSTPVYLPFSSPAYTFSPSFSFPISVPISLGGIHIGDFNLNWDGTYTVNPAQPALPSDPSIVTLLNQIKACSCPRLEIPTPPNPTYDTAIIPYCQQSDCSILSLSIPCEQGTWTQQDYDLAMTSAQLAKSQCQNAALPQGPEVLLISGTSDVLNTQFLTDKLSPDIKSVVVKITSYNSNNLKPVNSFSDADQFHFGNICWVGENYEGGGISALIFDPVTYFRIPLPVVTGRLRLLLVAGTTFSLYDTGERFSYN